MILGPVWLDGRLAPPDEARASVLSHAMQRGSAVFDVGAMRETSRGGVKLFRPREHVERFLKSAALVGLDVKYDVETLLEATVETARASGATSALVRWSAFVSTVEADVVARPGTRANVAIAILVADDPGERSRTRSSVRVTVPSETRKAGPEVFPPQAKVAASYLGPMLAKRRALAKGFDDVVLLDREGRVAEAPTSNVFVVHGGAITTPPLERVLPGITRDSVLAIARTEGVPAREVHITAEELAGADEAFLTATSFPVRAIESIDGRVLRSGAPGPVTSRIVEILLACERGEDARFEGWTTHVR